ncbi:MAG: geranylgeranylglycerol-phosphate geranylgeranyltransferase [Calditrichaceae bacterium]|nr:geranylgeranylglycerol-phosphate geranylgeranyltransferase [Calditrichaceae bacterium]
MLFGLWKIIRPLNVLIAILTILIAAFITGEFVLNLKLILAMIIAGMITAGANIINDIYDLEIDRINKPGRVLPSGIMTIRTAKIFFIINYLLSLVLAFFTGWEMFIIAVIIGLLLFIYSTHFKRTIIWGNIIVSFSSAMAFIYGALAVDTWKAGIIPAVFAFFFHFGREIIKDMQDTKGDMAENAITFPGKYGIVKSVLLINVIFILLVFLTILPYILGIYNIRYLVTVVFGVDFVLLTVSVVLWFRNDPAFLGKLSHLLKLDMIVGLTAIYLGV